MGPIGFYTYYLLIVACCLSVGGMLSLASFESPSSVWAPRLGALFFGSGLSMALLLMFGLVPVQ